MRRSSVLLVAAALLALAGCGGGGKSSSVDTVTAPTGGPAVPAKPAGPSDAAQIRKAIDDVLAAKTPAHACGAAVTAAYLKQTYGDATTCKQSQGRGSAASSVKVSGIKVAGTNAEATAIPKGGPSNGEKIKVTLVKQGGVWKLNSQHSNAPVGP